MYKKFLRTSLNVVFMLFCIITKSPHCHSVIIEGTDGDTYTNGERYHLRICPGNDLEAWCNGYEIGHTSLDAQARLIRRFRPWDGAGADFLVTLIDRIRSGHILGGGCFGLYLGMTHRIPEAIPSENDLTWSALLDLRILGAALLETETLTMRIPGQRHTTGWRICNVM